MKKVVFVLVPLLMLMGLGVGLAALGIVKVPFLPFGKKKAKAPPVDDGKGGPLAPLLTAMRSAAQQGEAEAKAKAAAPAPPKPPPDTSAGEAKLAGLWAEMPTDRLVALVEKWPTPQLGRILTKMDPEAVTNLLAALPAPRAQTLSAAVAAATDDQAQKVRADVGK